MSFRLSSLNCSVKSVTANLCPTLPPSPSTSSMSKNHKSNTLGGQRARSVIKSFSATGLSLMIPPFIIESSNNGLQMKSPGSCSALNSPCRDVPLITSLKPPIILRRGPSGFGFTVNTIRVYFGDSDFYTMHHLVMAVDSGSPAFEAGLSPGDLITHVNGEQVQGMNHTQVLQLLLSGGDKATLRSTPLEFTTIKTGGRRREPGQSKLASNARHRGLGFAHHSHRHKRSQRKDIPAGESRRRQKSSLFRRISTKCTPDYQQLTIMGNRSPAGVVAQDSVAAAAVAVSSTSADYSSSTSSSSSSANSSPTVTPNSPTPYQRPSTLHGLKHKLHSATKNLHSPNRRKSVGHIPLSPLARTPSPSPLPQSPTRSPSPLTFSSGHQPGSSNTTQSYSPSSLTSSNPAAGAGGVTASGCGAAAGVGGSGGPSGCCISTGAVVVVKKTAGSSFGRPCKTSEPGSPLLRRALSPDRLHPRTAETKSNSISPLCDPALKVTTHHAPRVTVTTKSPPMCARGPGAAAANLPLSKTCTTTTTTTTATKILQNNSAASTPNAEEKAVVVPAASKNEQPPSSQVNKLFSADVGSGAAGHVSLPRIAEERDHLQQNQLHHHHHHNHQLMQPTVAAAAVVDRPKPAKSANGGCRYFFNRKYKQQREQQQQQQQQQQPQPQTPPPCCKPDEACKNGATGKHGAANDTSPPATSSTHQP